MKFAATLLILAVGANGQASDDANCISTCGSCYDSSTHVLTCYTQYVGNCESGYWFAGSDCNEANATCYSTYNSYGRYCIEGGTSASGNTYAALDGCCSFTHEDIAGYYPNSDVGDHEMIDVDVAAMSTWLDDYNFSKAYLEYSQGGGSLKSYSGSWGNWVYVYRTVQGFSKDLSGEAMYDIYNAYWGSTTYADDFVSAALMGTTDPGSNVDFGSLIDDARVQLAMKGAAYQNVWMYVLHELEAAIEDCDAGVPDDDDHVDVADCTGCHAWDEGWAFWAGSHQSEGSTDGYLVYTLAEKRCTNFGTCGADGTSKDSADRPSYVNRELLSQYNSGLTNLQAGSCSLAQANLDAIAVLMTIPLIQGTLRYAYKCDPAALNEGDEACAEAYAFAAALLPQISNCDAAAATTVKSNMIPGANIPDGFAAVKAAVESTYRCMGIQCSDIGGLYDGDSYYSGMEPCSFSPSAAPTYTAAPLSGAAAVGPKMLTSVFAVFAALAALIRA